MLMEEQMNLVLYKESNKDVDIVTKYIMDLSDIEEQTKLIALLEKIDQFGAKYLVETHEVNTKKLAKDLYEIKVSKNRFLYCYRKVTKCTLYMHLENQHKRRQLDI